MPSSSIKASFGKHVTAVGEGEQSYSDAGGFLKRQLKSKCEYVCSKIAGRRLRLASVMVRQTNTSGGIALETRHRLPAASNSFASGWKQSSDSDREIANDDHALMGWICC